MSGRSSSSSADAQIVAGKHRPSEILHNTGAQRRHPVSRQTEGWGWWWWLEGGGRGRACGGRRGRRRLRFKFLFSSCKRLGAVIPLRFPQGHSDSRDVMPLLLSLKPRVCSATLPRRDIMAMKSRLIASREGYLFIRSCWKVRRMSAPIFAFYRTGEIL